MIEKPANTKILLVIVIAQFAGTSLWFVGNAVLPELTASLNLSQYAVSQVSSAVMLGFITGTLVIAISALADRFSPVRLFFVSSFCGALCNVAVAWLANDAGSLLTLRFFTGFFIAGIYPVGMKIAADWYEKGLGKAMGYLLGALILGTAFPYLLKNRDFELPWKSVLYATSCFAIIGGLLMLFFVGDGPYRKKSGKFQWNVIGKIFGSRKWRQAAFAYFGHMWELYAFWGFLPLVLGLYAAKHKADLNISLLTFLVIGIGGIGAVVGGYLSERWGSAKVGGTALIISGCCCFISPVAYTLPLPFFMVFIFIWGATVSPDSPQFSTLVAKFAPEQLRGTALTIYNSIGFGIATLSLIVIDHVFNSTGFFAKENSLFLLGFGALISLPNILRLVKYN